LTLAAFLVAAASQLIKILLRRKENLIKTAPEGERAQLVEITLEGFSVDTTNLTKDQKFTLLMTQMEHRAQRWKAVVRLAILVTFVAGSVTIAFVFVAPLLNSFFTTDPNGTVTSTPDPQTPTSTPTPQTPTSTPTPEMPPKETRLQQNVRFTGTVGNNHLCNLETTIEYTPNDPSNPPEYEFHVTDVTGSLDSPPYSTYNRLVSRDDLKERILTSASGRIRVYGNVLEISGYQIPARDAAWSTGRRAAIGRDVVVEGTLWIKLTN